jgi:hypothetical protein
MNKVGKIEVGVTPVEEHDGEKVAGEQLEDHLMTRLAEKVEKKSAEVGQRSIKDK